MRLSDRLRRLERHRDDDPRMTPAEIEAAAERFEAELTGEGSPPGVGPLPNSVTPDQARTAWRGLVDCPGPGFMQRTFANMDPMDIFL